MSRNKNILTLVFGLLWIGQMGMCANAASDNTYDFSVEKSIWGKGPVNDIAPEVASESNRDSFVDPFEKAQKIEPSKPENEREKRIQQMLKERQTIKYMPLLTEKSHCSVGLGFVGGLNKYLISSDFGDNSLAFSPGIALDIYYFFNQNWGVRTGLGLNFSHSTFKIDGTYTDQQVYTDYEGDKLTLDYKIGSVEETFRNTLLEVPVMLAYDYNDWIGAVGFKFGFPLSGSYEQTMKDVNITGHYPFSGDITNALAIGATQNGTIKKEGDFADKSVFVMLGGSFGRRFRINDMFDFGASAFVDYAVNKLKMNVSAKGDNSQGMQNEDGAFYLIRNTELLSENDLPQSANEERTHVSSVLCGVQGTTGKNIVDEMRYFRVGIKLSIYISNYGNGTKEARAEVERKLDQMR